MELQEVVEVVELNDIFHKAGSDNTGGVFEDFFFARKPDIASWPEIPEGASGAAKMVYVGGFEMKTGKRFYSGYMTPGTGSIKWNIQGPRDGKNFKTIFKLFIPGLEPETLATLSDMKNDNLVLIGRDKNHVLRVIGTEFISAKLEEGEGGTGDNSEGERGNTLSFIVDGTKNPPYIYKSEIQLTPQPGPL